MGDQAINQGKESWWQVVYVTIPAAKFIWNLVIYPAASIIFPTSQKPIPKQAQSLLFSSFFSLHPSHLFFLLLSCQNLCRMYSVNLPTLLICGSKYLFLWLMCFLLILFISLAPQQKIFSYESIPTWQTQVWSSWVVNVKIRSDIFCFSFYWYSFPTRSCFITLMRVHTVISRNVISLLCVIHLNVPLPKAKTYKASSTNAAMCLSSLCFALLGPKYVYITNRKQQNPWVLWSFRLCPSWGTLQHFQPPWARICTPQL